MNSLTEKTGNGFLFETYDAEGILWAVGEALKIYADTDKWNTLVKNCMNTKLSWNDSAEKYMELYKEMLNN